MGLITRASSFSLGVAAATGAAIYSRQLAWKRAEETSVAMREAAAEIPGAHVSEIPRVMAPAFEEPPQLYDLRAAGCQLARVSWNAAVVTLRGGAIVADQVVTKQAAQAEAAVKENTGPIIAKAHELRREAEAKVGEVETSVSRQIGEARAKALAMLPPALGGGAVPMHSAGSAAQNGGSAAPR